MKHHLRSDLIHYVDESQSDVVLKCLADWHNSQQHSSYATYATAPSENNFASSLKMSDTSRLITLTGVRQCTKTYKNCVSTWSKEVTIFPHWRSPENRVKHSSETFLSHHCGLTEIPPSSTWISSDWRHIAEHAIHTNHISCKWAPTYMQNMTHPLPGVGHVL